MANVPWKKDKPAGPERSVIERRQERAARVMIRKAEREGNGELVAQLARDHKFLREEK
jgi:hypothetical protein